MKRVLADITGPSLFEPYSYLFVIPVLWLTSVLSVSHELTAWSLLAWTIANAVAMLVCWGLVVFFDRAVFKNRSLSPAPIAGVIAASAFIGAVKGSLTTLVGYLLFVEPNLSLVFGGRMLQTAFFGVVTVPALAIVSATRKRFQEERDLLVAERVQKARAEGNGQLAQTSEILEKLLVDTKALIGTARARELAPFIRDIIANSLRPITHQLWDSNSSSSESFKFKDLSKAAILNHPFVATPVAMILFVGTLGPYISLVGVTAGFIRSASTALAILVGYSIARLRRPKNFANSLVHYIGSHLLLVAAYVWLCKVLLGDLPGYNVFTATILLFVWILQTGFMTSFIAGALATRRLVREQLEQLSKELGVDREVIKTRSMIANRELANHLHSNLQNKLMSLALKIEKNSENDDDIRAELEEIEKLIFSNSPNITDLNTRLDDLINRWVGFVELRIDNRLVDTKIEMTERILQVLSEALSNSLRHGLATSVEMRLIENNGHILIEVLDDGIGPRSGNQGLGSKFFTSIAGANWRLEPRETGGSRLELAFPVN